MQYQTLLKVSGVTPLLASQVLQVRNPEPDREVPAAGVLNVLIAGMLDKTGLVDPDERNLILRHFRSNFDWLAHELDSRVQGHKNGTRSLLELPLLNLGFADRRLVTLTNHDGFLVLDTGETILSLEKPPLETITYNLTTLYMTTYNTRKE